MSINDNTAPELQLRHKRKSYMECTQVDNAYHLIGEGFTNFAESKNPKEYSRHYIHEETERSDVTGYAPSHSYSCDVVSGDPVVDEIVYITDNELKGTATHRKVVTYNEFGGTAEARPAYRRTFSIVPDGSADGADALIYTGSMKAVTDVEKGTWNELTKQFTPEGGTATTASVGTGTVVTDGTDSNDSTDDTDGSY